MRAVVAWKAELCHICKIDFHIDRRERGRTYWKCEVCVGRAATLSWKDHQRTALHQRNVAARDERQRLPDRHLPAAPESNLDVEQADELVFDSIGHVPESITSHSDVNPFDDEESPAYNFFEDDIYGTKFLEEGIDWDEYLFEALNQLSKEKLTRDNFPKRRRMETQEESWYPFKSKEYLIGSLIMGYMHHIMSRELYAQLRLILSLAGCDLPHWTTLRQARNEIRNMLRLELHESTSILGSKCYAIGLRDILSHELSNPYVQPHLEFYPEETHGRNVWRSSQCQKWLKYLDPQYCAQMVVNKDKHFYIFEPVQLSNANIVVPIFFYKENTLLRAKCAIPQLHKVAGQSSWCLQIPSPLPFDSDLLVSIDVSDFELIYSEICMGPRGMLSTLCSNTLWESGRLTTSRQLPNPWRNKAGGRVIRHMPIHLYADDTSGNVSKQWNKHVSFYCILGGLPPKCTNMKYNCHFLSTSNQAGVLETGEQIVKELNFLATEGWCAYDMELDEEVLVTSIILSFQADSPMHAEVTNTCIPNNCLNPCRMCCLHATSLEARKVPDYICGFLHLDANGNHSPVASRSWSDISHQTYNLWETAQDGIKAHFDNATKLHGIRDTTNRYFIDILQDSETPESAMSKPTIDKLAKDHLERMFNPFLNLKGFDGCLDTPVEILHVFLLGPVKYLTRDVLRKLTPPQLASVVASWEAFDVNALNIASIKAQYMMRHVKSLIGKDFKIVLQSAPFVLYQFMSDAERSTWDALGTLATYLFETKIANMTDYLAKLKIHIDRFLCQIIRTSAQWVNKPKFHMLMHLPESIQRFGPASLFSTENFESFNSILRHASVHSNRLRPGRDLGLSFLHLHGLRMILSNARLTNSPANKYSHASSQVASVFADSPHIQNSMGYNPLQIKPATGFPSPLRSLLKKEDIKTKPTYFDQFPNSHVGQIAQLRLSEKDILKDGFFVLLAPDGRSSNQIIGRVESIWEMNYRGENKYILHLRHFLKKGVHGFYKMRILENANKLECYPVSDIKACLNVQHDCISGKCKLIANTKPRQNLLESAPTPHIIQHSDDAQYILNSASLHSSTSHRQLASLRHEEITSDAWNAAITEGVATWKSRAQQRLVKRAKTAQNKADVQNEPTHQI